MLVVGINHKRAPIALLERLTIAPEELPKALHQLAGYEHVLEGAVLSTCNRTEVYAVASKFHGGAQDLRNFISEFCHVEPEALTDRLYTYHDEAAIRHLFRVTAGIDSMIVGESEILGQVRRSFQAAVQEGSARRVLGAVFRRALRVGKRARAETGIGRNPVSMGWAAVELARRIGGDVTGRRVVVVGAGEMGRLAGRSFMQHGAGQVSVVNRSRERSDELALEWGGASLSLEELADALARADIAVCCTTAPELVVDRKTVERAVGARTRGGLIIIDVAVPHDVDPAAGDVPGVHLATITDLQAIVEANLGSRLGEIAGVEAIIDEEVARFVEWERADAAAPAASAIIAAAEGIRKAEVERFVGPDKALSPDQRELVDLMTKRIVAKMLHTPLNRARRLAGTKQGSVYLAALRELFDLDDHDRGAE